MRNKKGSTYVDSAIGSGVYKLIFYPDSWFWRTFFGLTGSGKTLKKTRDYDTAIKWAENEANYPRIRYFV